MTDPSNRLTAKRIMEGGEHASPRLRPRQEAAEEVVEHARRTGRELVEQIAKLAETANRLREEARDPHYPLSGEAWVELDWLADELLELDKTLALDALTSA